MYRFSTRSRLTLAALATVGATAACATDGTTNPNSAATAGVSFSISTATPSTIAGDRLDFSSSTSGGSLVFSSGADTLQIDSIRVVLAQVVLSRAADTTCGSVGHNDDTDASCADLNAGPLIVNLPLTAGVSSLFSVPTPDGTYSGLAVRVHKPNRADSGPNTTTFLAAHPDWENVSIRVDGTFDGKPVHWHGDPVLQFKAAFVPPVTVASSSGLNFTLNVDIASWFRASSGALIDPNTVTGALYPQVATNIANSFHVFSDDQKKGADDHTHDGGGN